MNNIVILWDWNGTLLNDVDQGLAAMNELLARRNMPGLSKAKYREIFDFPVIEYYRLLGFDFEKEPWEQVAAEFMSAYHSKEPDMSLFKDAIPALNFFQAKGYRQFVLSAMKTESIMQMLDAYGIRSFFQGVYGLDNHYANGKIEVGHHLLEAEGLTPGQCLMIGDTLHDAEVAGALNSECVLVSQGHQSFKRLSIKQNRVIPSLNELGRYVCDLITNK